MLRSNADLISDAANRIVCETSPLEDSFSDIEVNQDLIAENPEDSFSDMEINQDNIEWTIRDDFNNEFIEQQDESDIEVNEKNVNGIPQPQFKSEEIDASDDDDVQLNNQSANFAAVQKEIFTSSDFRFDLESFAGGNLHHKRKRADDYADEDSDGEIEIAQKMQEVHPEDGEDSSEKEEDDVKINLEVHGFDAQLNPFGEEDEEITTKNLEFNRQGYLSQFPLEQKIEAMDKICIGRRGIVATLLSLFGNSADKCRPIFVFGNSGTGKSFVVSSILENCCSVWAYLNCLECQNPSFLYESILEQISPPKRGRSHKCQTLPHFVNMLLQATIQRGVFDNVHRLFELGTIGPILLSGFFRLNEFLGASLSVVTILISTFSWPKLIQVNNTLTSTKEILEIVARGSPEPLFKTFASLIWDTFSSTTNSINEVKYLIQCLYPLYKRPIEQATATADQTNLLFKEISQYLKKDNLCKLYLREVSISQMRQGGKTFQSRESKEVTDLSSIAKRILVASYLASHNPAKLDRRLFSVVNVRTSVAQEKKLAHTFAGPKIFPLDRMLAIFASIFDITLDYNLELYVQITTLVSLKLLTAISPSGTLDHPRYKCNIGTKLLDEIAKDLKFDVTRFLCT